MAETRTQDVLIVGAGFAGIYALYRMKQLGLNARVIEKGDGIGGTWYWNAYPGARCDVESFEYSYSFDEDLQQQWRWSERYATQPEIRRYIEHVVERYELAADIQLGVEMQSARWLEDKSLWHVNTSDGDYQARFLIMASGCLSHPNIPSIAGMDKFQGPLFHTGHWPQQGVDLEGKRVAVIGTGSSGVQVISNIAPVAGELYVFQRTPHYVVPAGIRPISPEEDAEVKGRYKAFREQLASSLLGMGVSSRAGAAKEASAEERQQRYEESWQTGGPCFLMSFDDLLIDSESNATACEFVADKIRSIVEDETTAEALIPDISRYPVGARRLVLDDNYYSRFNQPNVHLVDCLQDPIREITETGIKQESGRHTELDIIIVATGYDALTGALLDVDIQGKSGQSLQESWKHGPGTYLGLAMQGFPNLFSITGPGSPSVFSNVVLSIEQHVDFITDMIRWMQSNHYSTMQPLPDAQQQWGKRVMAVAEPTVLMKVKSWYWGANVAGKPQAFLPYLGGVGTYREECLDVAEQGYKGFEFS